MYGDAGLILDILLTPKRDHKSISITGCTCRFHFSPRRSYRNKNERNKTSAKQHNLLIQLPRYKCH